MPRDKKKGRNKRKTGTTPTPKPNNDDDVNSEPLTGDDLIHVECEQSRFHADQIGESKELNIRGISISIAGKTLIDNARLIVSPGRRYALLGRNGVGKSTFMKAMAQGKISLIGKKLRIVFLGQHMIEQAQGDECVQDFVVQGHTELIDKRNELDQLLESGDGSSEWVKKLEDVQTSLEILKSDMAEDIASDILLALGFTSDMIEGPIKNLSGGWKVRAILATSVLVNPDILLLDEPTNHLDLEGLLWLGEFLNGLEYCVIMVSHDKKFMDSVATDVMELKDKKFEYFHGNLTALEEHKEEKMTHQNKLFEVQERKRKHIEESIQKGIQHAKRTGDDKVLGMVASRQKKLDDRLGMEKREDGKRWKTNTRRETRTMKQYESCVDGTRQQVEAVKAEKEVVFKFGEAANLLVGGSVVSLESMFFKYPGSDDFTLKDVTFNIQVGEKVGIMGNNGAGKSTLINLIVGSLEATRGQVKRLGQANIQLFNQHHMDRLNPEDTPLDHFHHLFPKVNPHDLRQHLGAFGVTGKLAVIPMSHLSGGQLTRVSLAQLTFHRPQLLILDEPTNHLDQQSIQALAKGIQAYNGAVLVVSHDRWFINASTSAFWTVQAGLVERFEGNVDEYAASVQKQVAKQVRKVHRKLKALDLQS